MIRATLDADVLYPMPLRDTLLTAASLGCFQPCWSAEILEETTRNLEADGRLTKAQAARLRTQMALAFEDALVEGYEHLIDAMPNHPKDRHVAACAVHAKASLIVTNNLKDFATLPAGVTAISPDDFLCLLFDRSLDLLAAALTEQVERLKKPPMTLDDLLARYASIAPKFVRAWHRHFTS